MLSALTTAVGFIGRLCAVLMYLSVVLAVTVQFGPLIAGVAIGLVLPGTLPWLFTRHAGKRQAWEGLQFFTVAGIPVAVTALLFRGHAPVTWLSLFWPGVPALVFLTACCILLAVPRTAYRWGRLARVLAWLVSAVIAVACFVQAAPVLAAHFAELSALPALAWVIGPIGALATLVAFYMNFDERRVRSYQMPIPPVSEAKTVDQYGQPQVR